MNGRWNSGQYRNDTLFRTAPDHPCYRGGIYYETNQYGVNMLRQAVTYGYAESFQAGSAGFVSAPAYGVCFHF